MSLRPAEHVPPPLELCRLAYQGELLWQAVGMLGVAAEHEPLALDPTLSRRGLAPTHAHAVLTHVSLATWALRRLLETEQGPAAPREPWLTPTDWTVVSGLTEQLAQAERCWGRSS